MQCGHLVPDQCEYPDGTLPWQVDEPDDAPAFGPASCAPLPSAVLERIILIDPVRIGNDENFAESISGRKQKIDLLLIVAERRFGILRKERIEVDAARAIRNFQDGYVGNAERCYRVPIPFAAGKAGIDEDGIDSHIVFKIVVRNVKLPQQRPAPCADNVIGILTPVQPVSFEDPTSGK